MIASRVQVMWSSQSLRMSLRSASSLRVDRRRDCTHVRVVVGVRRVAVGVRVVAVRDGEGGEGAEEGDERRQRERDRALGGGCSCECSFRVRREPASWPRQQVGRRSEPDDLDRLGEEREAVDRLGARGGGRGGRS